MGIILIFVITALLSLLPEQSGKSAALISTAISLLSILLAFLAMKESTEQMRELKTQSEDLRAQSVELQHQSSAQIGRMDEMLDGLRTQSGDLRAQSVELQHQSSAQIGRMDEMLDGLRTQSEDLRAQSEEMRTRSTEQIERINIMHAAITTKYVNSFPADMDSLIALLESAEYEISVLIDVAGYGHWSRHKSFKQYEQLLIRKNEAGVKVHIAMYDMESWDEITPRLFRPPYDQEQLKRDPDLREHFHKLKSSPKTTDYWADLNQRIKNEERPSSVDAIQTLDDFIARLRADEVHYRQTIPGIDVLLSTKTHLPLLCWMADGSQAVYSFIFDRSDEGIRESDSLVPSLPSSVSSTDAYKRYQDTTYEITFVTSDPYLIKELKNVMRSYAPSLLIDGETGPPASPGKDIVLPATRGDASSQREVPSAEQERS
jgi:hypothetical protein